MVKNNLDFIEENSIDFQEEAKPSAIDFQAEETTPLLKGRVEFNSLYQNIQNDKSLTTEEKINKIKSISDSENKRIDKEHRIKMAKLYGGAGLEIGSSAIPVGGVAKVGSSVALKLAKPTFSQISKKVIAQNIGSGIASGATSGAMFGMGEGMMQDHNINDIAIDSVNGAKDGA